MKKSWSMTEGLTATNPPVNPKWPAESSDPRRGRGRGLAPARELVQAGIREAGVILGSKGAAWREGDAGGAVSEVVDGVIAGRR